ncbi:O-linked N-acetylglucosamine transferase, SPINDLY family protein [Pseudorhodoferax sp.]|uniref:O-linked N-acetylglucosamine transferase, SPINDLY family protein n=1 Tax=Pseudorhodoferax sp. TaxID=1993553 RepID=UPI002DD629AE|nr:tetratricopeptide repeat protein [Pseudorhodoferax sp.]
MRHALRDAKSSTQSGSPRAAPGRARAAWQAGQAHARRGAWDEAVRCFETATRQAPNDPVLALNLARALLAQRKLDEAAQQAARAFNLDPRNPVTCALTAHCLMEGKRFRDAARCLQSLPADVARGHDYFHTLGRALQLGRQPREAVDAYMSALAINITHADTHYQLGLCLNDLSMKEEAAQSFQTALAMGVGEHELGIRALLAYFEREACNWVGADEGLQRLQAALDALPDDAAVATAPFAHVTLLEDPMQQLKAAASLARNLAAQARPFAARRSDWRPEGSRRLKLGYLSADFHEHATCILMAEMLEHHDRKRFEVTLYSHGKPDGSAMRKRIEQACEHFVDLRGQSDGDIATRIRADGCDLLIDLKGYTRNHRVGVFAWKPAPVTATFLGFPGSTGADFIDYLIADPVVTPLEHTPYYTEHLAQMPVCYQPNDRQRALPAAPTRTEAGLPEDAFVMAGFNQPYKISSQVFDVWCVLLDALPQAVLWLLDWNEQSRQNLAREAAARGIDPARIVWAPRKKPAEHMARMQLADVFIDTWPCNAHTTASDALWAAVPVVTFTGETFASRVAASLVHAVGLPELACRDIEHYARTVVELAHDPGRLAAMRQTLVAAREHSPLFDSRRFTRDFEALLLRMMQRHVDGLPPAPLPAAASTTDASA